MKKGFTLIELLIVIAIIAILATAIIVTITPGERLAEARDATRASHLTSIETAMYAYNVDNETLPAATDLSDSTMTEICDTEGGGDCDTWNLIDLSTLEMPIPVDPSGGVATDGVGYYVAAKNSRIYLCAPRAEETADISIGTLTNIHESGCPSI